MKRLEGPVVGWMKKRGATSRLQAGVDLSCTWLTEAQAGKWQTCRKQRTPSCVGYAAVRLLLCQCGTVMERFWLSPRSSAGKRVQPSMLGFVYSHMVLYYPPIVITVMTGSNLIVTHSHIHKKYKNKIGA